LLRFAADLRSSPQQDVEDVVASSSNVIYRYNVFRVTAAAGSRTLGRWPHHPPSHGPWASTIPSINQSINQPFTVCSQNVNFSAPDNQWRESKAIL